jgi:hypothetical protein
MTLILAFETIRWGNDLIAIGASVVDENLNELDILLLKGYFPTNLDFDLISFYNFWVYHLETLKYLTYEGPLTKHDRQTEIINEFLFFIDTWLLYSKSNHLQLKIITDNNLILETSQILSHIISTNSSTFLDKISPLYIMSNYYDPSINAYLVAYQFLRKRK